MNVPFFRPEIGDAAEIAEVEATLRSGWLTTGPRVAGFQREFAAAVGAPHAVALNSCTAAMHLAVEALGLGPGLAVLVPAMTFAATAEVVRYQGAFPVLVDCDPLTLHMDLDDAERRLEDVAAGRLGPSGQDPPRVVGMIPVHVGGLMMDPEALAAFARRHRLWIVEDAAHSFPAAWRAGPDRPWRRCGEGTADVSCFSFYANKTITTGEGGMAVTGDEALARRMSLQSLHGLSRDSWARHEGDADWDYRIVLPGFKYNLTDIAAAIGIHQLRRSEQMRRRREAVVERYRHGLAAQEELRLAPVTSDHVHAWHLFWIELQSPKLDRNSFVSALASRGVGFSVHWRPLHLHPFYRETYGYLPEHCPRASAIWQRLVSLPLFSGMSDREVDHVINSVRELCLSHAA